MTEQNQGAGIAIVGMGGRFPGARGVDEFWSNLAAGVETITIRGADPEEEGGERRVFACGALEDADLFDAAFFGFNPKEAMIADPQHRLFLECAWEALESAGYCGSKYEGRVGVFAGRGVSRQMETLLADPALVASLAAYQVGIATGVDAMPTQVSYKLDLHGPAFAVQTACSSSLVAVHLACQSLLSGESDMVLAGGVNVKPAPEEGYVYEEGGTNSPDGHCRAFDARAAGTVWGCGASIVVLKRLEDALEDGDTVHAVIRGSAINNDGARKVGYTAPSVSGQAEVVMEALEVAGIHPSTVSYVEAHGTGTPVGDPIEVAALTRVFRAYGVPAGSVGLGSVKTNIGHLEAAAGVAGLIKVALSLRHEVLPPSLHFEEPNPEIDFAASPFFVNASARPWPRGAAPRRAGISSFGIGGTNAHVVVEEAPPAPPADPAARPPLFVLSARTPAALAAQRANLRRHLEAHPEVSPDDAAHTLRVGRAEFAHRLAFVPRDREELLAALDGALPEGRAGEGVAPATERRVVFLFPGGSAQHAGMAATLYRREAVFRDEVDRCARVLLPELGFDLRALLFGGDGHGEVPRGMDVNRTAVMQPALFTVEWALARLWTSWGVRPAAMLGHSLGEYVAATLAGVFEVEEALRLVAARARLIDALPAGAMLAVGLPEEETRALLGEHLSLAALNGPATSVVSGPPAAVEALRERLEAEGTWNRRLEVSHAFHSAMMEPVMARFEERVRQAGPRAPEMPYLSCITGTWITPEEAASPRYWTRHLREAVRFSPAAETLLADAAHVFVEVGPGRALTRLVGEHEGGEGRVAVSSLPPAGSDAGEDEHLLAALGRLWCAGVGVDWNAFAGGERRRRVPLPTYPFERQRFALPRPAAAGPAAPAAETGAFRKTPPEEWFHAPSWTRTLPPRVRAAEAGQRWLVFADGSVGPRAAALLEAAGHAVATVRAGDGFEREGDGAFRAHPSRPEDVAAVLDALASADAYPTGVLHLWGLDAEDPEGAERLGFHALAHLAQAVGDRFLDRPLRVVVAAAGVHEVSGSETLRPEGALLLGPALSWPMENPNVSARLADLDADEVARAPREAARRLVAEALGEGTAPVAAFRGGHRWEPRFEGLRVEGPEGGAARIRERGVYLVTGGLGGIGLALAESLAERARARLVLAGRTPLPPRETWEEWLASRPGHRLSRAIEAVRRMEAAGARVETVEADVGDPAQARALVRRAREAFGALHGVIHSAGVLGDTILQRITPRGVAPVLGPKVAGTLHLADALRGEPLDFLVLCASFTGVVGGAGQAAYCAANAFQGALAPVLARRGVPVLSIDWCGWREAGMAADVLTAEARERALTNAEGVDAFWRALGSGLPRVGILPERVEAMLWRVEASRRRAAAGEADAAAAPDAAEEASVAYVRPAHLGEYVAPRNPVEERVAAIWQQLLGIGQVGATDGFLELGGHSLLAIRLLSRIQKDFRVKVSFRTLMEAATVAGLAGEITRAILAETAPEAEPEAAGVSA